MKGGGVGYFRIIYRRRHVGGGGGSDAAAAAAVAVAAFTVWRRQETIASTARPSPQLPHSSNYDYGLRIPAARPPCSFALFIRIRRRQLKPIFHSALATPESDDEPSASSRALRGELSSAAIRLSVCPSVRLSHVPSLTVTVTIMGRSHVRCPALLRCAGKTLLMFLLWQRSNVQRMCERLPTELFTQRPTAHHRNNHQFVPRCRNADRPI